MASKRKFPNEVGTSDDPQVQENLITFGPDFKETLTKLLAMMKSKLDRPQVLSFSGMTEDDLSKLNIEYGGSLKLKTDCKVRADATKELGKTEHWSSEGLYRHLLVLQKLIARVNEAASRPWIDSFFFRASEMLPQGKQLVLRLGQSLPSTTVGPFGFTTLRGYMDYTAISTGASGAAAILTQPRLDTLQKRDNTLFVIEAKTWSMSLRGHVPQAVREMYACAKQLGKKITRGAVTDGHNWIFLVLKMNPNGDGAIYADSQEVHLMTRVPFGEEEVSRLECDVVAGIIAHWIEHSDEDVGEDDWFSMDIE